MSDESMSQQDYEEIGRFIYAFHRDADPEQLRAAVASGELAPDVAERAASLVRRFDEVVDKFKRNSAPGSPDAVGDDELQAILAELQAFVARSGWTHDAQSSR